MSAASSDNNSLAPALPLDSFLNDLIGNEVASTSTVLPAGRISIERPAGTTQIVGTNGKDFLEGTSGSNNIFAAGGSDAIVAGGGNNYIFATDAKRRGAFENDYLNVVGGEDTIFLGDENGSYYTANGWLDSVYIDGFDVADDRLVLFGSSDLYSLRRSDQGTWLMLGDDDTTAVAYLNGVTNFELDGSAALYTAIADSPGVLPDEGSEDSGSDAPLEQTGLPSVLSLQPEIRDYDDVGGTVGDDLLLGGDGADRLLGFLGRDYAFGGGGADLFVLGDLSGTYYTQQGWADSVYIDDFTVGEDQLQLNGSASQYSTISNRSGSWILAEGEAIAYLNGITSVDLNSFQYVSL